MPTEAGPVAAGGGKVAAAAVVAAAAADGGGCARRTQKWKKMTQKRKMTALSMMSPCDGREAWD